jgi:hypothetical protein
MQALIQQIESLHAEMKDLTLMAGVPDSQYAEVVKADELLNAEILTERLDFLKEVRTGPFEEVRKVWVLVPAATWEMYKLLGQKRLAEQTLLRKKQKSLKKSWNDRYGGRQ